MELFTNWFYDNTWKLIFNYIILIYYLKYEILKYCHIFIEEW
jgi:hypothetical protein